MAKDRPIDPGQTYILEETAITRLHSLEELAEIALGKGEGSNAANGVDARNGHGPELRRSGPGGDRRGRTGA